MIESIRSLREPEPTPLGGLHSSALPEILGGSSGPAIEAGRLRSSRRARGWSQRQLARLSGISRGAIQNLERGRTRIPHPETLYVLAKALRVEPTELLAAPERRGAPVRRLADPGATHTLGQPTPAALRSMPRSAPKIVLARIELPGGASWIPIGLARESADGTLRLELDFVPTDATTELALRDANPAGMTGSVRRVGAAG